MPRRAWRTWDEVFLYYLDVKGWDHGAAAWRADQWRTRLRARQRKGRR